MASVTPLIGHPERNNDGCGIIKQKTRPIYIGWYIYYVVLVYIFVKVFGQSANHSHLQSNGQTPRPIWYTFRCVGQVVKSHWPCLSAMYGILKAN